jgi:hypothetical protein
MCLIVGPSCAGDLVLTPALVAATKMKYIRTDEMFSVV